MREPLAFSSGLWTLVSEVWAAGSKGFDERGVLWTLGSVLQIKNPSEVVTPPLPQMQQNGKTGQVRKSHMSTSMTGIGQ